jgi:hypothetical protein
LQSASADRPTACLRGGGNAIHGLRRTIDDKRREVGILLADAEWSKWSDRKIAEACGVTHPFVAAVRSPEAAKRQAENRTTGANKVETDSTQATGKVETDSTHEPESFGPSAAEMAAQEAEAKDDAERVRVILESDDALAEMTAKCKQQSALIRSLQERINVLMCEKLEAVQRAKHWKAKSDTSRGYAPQSADRSQECLGEARNRNGSTSSTQMTPRTSTCPGIGPVTVAANWLGQVLANGPVSSASLKALASAAVLLQQGAAVTLSR